MSKSILESLGGEAGCRRLAKDFYARVAQDSLLKPLFPGKSLRCASEEFAAFLIQFLDGDPAQTQYRWWLSLRHSHARFTINEQQRLAWLRLMDATLNSVVVEDLSVRSGLSQFFREVSRYIVEGTDADLTQDELSCRWSAQADLDQLVADIAAGRDDDAIALARKQIKRPSVLVGILAEMMLAKRGSLVEFALEMIENRALWDARFNGRTLLHFSAGSGCFRVVEKLLTLGLDPDVLDSGGHAPLYRAASGRSGEEGAAIVAALVHVGATVDLCGGVNRSTALHEAARHGNFGVARALLEAGARLDFKDKNGFTPHDRAVRCKRHEVADLLQRWTSS